MTKFHDYLPAYQIIRQGTNDKEDKYKFYAREYAKAKMAGDTAVYNQLMLEAIWLKRGRAYYNIWANIIPAFLRLQLSVDSNQINVPQEVILLRLPDKVIPQLEFEHEGNKYQPRTILMSEATIDKNRGISMWIDIGEHMDFALAYIPIYTYRNFPCIVGTTIEQALASLPHHPTAKIGVWIPPEIMQQIVRLCCAICLLAEDPEIIEPDVLTADTAKFDATHDPKYIDRAHRRGKVGWNVGKSFEVQPHIRLPHLALYHIGEGRRQTKIMMRKGSVIHKEIVKKMPTGYEDLK